MIYSEIMNLTSKFYIALDTKDYDALSFIFNENGVWHRPNGDIIGRKNISNSLKRRNDNRVTSHQVNNLTIINNGSEIISRYYLTVYSNQTEKLNPTVILFMQDIWIKSDGEWSILSKKSKDFIRK